MAWLPKKGGRGIIPITPTDPAVPQALPRPPKLSALVDELIPPAPIPLFSSPSDARTRYNQALNQYHSQVIEILKPLARRLDELKDLADLSVLNETDEAFLTQHPELRAQLYLRNILQNIETKSGKPLDQLFAESNQFLAQTFDAIARERAQLEQSRAHFDEERRKYTEREAHFTLMRRIGTACTIIAVGAAVTIGSIYYIRKQTDAVRISSLEGNLASLSATVTSNAENFAAFVEGYEHSKEQILTAQRDANTRAIDAVEGLRSEYKAALTQYALQTTLDARLTAITEQQAPLQEAVASSAAYAQKLQGQIEEVSGRTADLSDKLQQERQRFNQLNQRFERFSDATREAISKMDSLIEHFYSRSSTNSIRTDAPTTNNTPMTVP